MYVIWSINNRIIINIKGFQQNYSEEYYAKHRCIYCSYIYWWSIFFWWEYKIGITNQIEALRLFQWKSKWVLATLIEKQSCCSQTAMYWTSLLQANSNSGKLQHFSSRLSLIAFVRGIPIWEKKPRVAFGAFLPSVVLL